MGKVFFFTVVAVFAGIWIFSMATKPKGKTKTPTAKDVDGMLFEGPDIDPVTGAHLGPGAKVGTVNFPAQPVGN